MNEALSNDLPNIYWKKFFKEGYFYSQFFHLEPTGEYNRFEVGYSETERIPINLN